MIMKKYKNINISSNCMFLHVSVPDSLGAITSTDVLRTQISSDILPCHPADLL